MATILVTGGGRGIGRAIALAFAEPGAVVAIAARTRADLDATAREIEKRGARPVLLAVDVRDEQSVAAGFRELRAASERLDVLVNNAGVGGGQPIQDADPSGWRTILDTNVFGTFLVTRQAVPLLSDGGRIINTSSVLGRFGVPGYTAYCASKHAVIGFTRALALELAGRQITVNAICPGWVDTEMAAQGMQMRRRGDGHHVRGVQGAGDRPRPDRTDHSARRSGGPGEVPRVAARVRDHRSDLQHLRRPDYGLIAVAAVLASRLALGLQPFQLHLRMIRERHRVGDRAVAGDLSRSRDASTGRRAGRPDGPEARSAAR